MNFGFSGEAFGNLLVCSGLTGVLLGVYICIRAYKRGVNIFTHRFQLSLAFIISAIFTIFPFWLAKDLTIKWKFIGTILMVLVGLGNYYAIDRMQKAIRENYIKNDKIKTEK